MRKWILIALALAAATLAGIVIDLRIRAGDYWSLFAEAGKAHGVPARLLAAQALQESGFDPKAVSGAGAEGIMQLEPQFYPGVDPWDPAQAIPAAAQSMHHYHYEFGTWRLALAAYNWGPGSLDLWQKSGAPESAWPAETRHYVSRVLLYAGVIV